MKRSSFRLLLLPFSLLYGLGVWIRNMLFNAEILPSQSFDLPVISVGNITVGGTGKTPHVEFLIRLLSKDYQVAVLSRGYKRKSKGFVLADGGSHLADLGDEPLQMKRKFPNLVVAVDGNRRNGIRRLTDPLMDPFVDVVLLDDAFQHRFVSPSISILLIDFNRLIQDDFLLPAGDLREPAGQMKRAQIVIVSKCPIDLKPMDLRVLSTKIDILPYQTLYFTTLAYGSLQKLTPFARHEEARETLEPTEISDAEITAQVSKTDPFSLRTLDSLDQIREQQLPVLLISGIANPETFEEQMRKYAPDLSALHFPDHHVFGKRDARRIQQEFEKIHDRGGIILTTEKDAARIRLNPYLEHLSHHMYYPSLEIRFLDGKSEVFEQKISDYVRINKRKRKVS